MLEFIPLNQLGFVLGCLLGAAVVLTLLTYVAFFLYPILKEGGCLAIFVIFVVIIPALLHFGNFVYNCSNIDRVCEIAITAHEKLRDSLSAVSVFRTERVRLYQYYQELRQRKEQCESYIRELEDKREELTSKQAQSALTQEIKNVRTETDKLAKILQSIEDVAGRIYFARLMRNLGASADTSELDGEMDTIQRTSEQLIKTQKNMKQ